MTRVANAANEDYLLMIAEHGSAQHVAELVRKYRGFERREACEKAMTQQVERTLAYYWDDGLLNIRAQLPAEQGAVFLNALQSASEQIECVDATEEEADNVTLHTPYTGENATAVAPLLEEQRNRQVNGPQQRADGGETSLDNLTLLCRHHHRLVHEGGFAVQKTHDGQLIFIRPDGKALERAPQPRQATQWVEAMNDKNGISIDHGTLYR